MSSFTVTPHRPWRRRVLLAVVLALLGGAGWLLFEAGRLQAGIDRDGWRDTERELREQVGELKRHIEGLVRDNALLRRSADIDREAFVEVERALADAQAQMLEVREELSFYRGLVTPSDRVGGLHVERLELHPGDEERRFDYRLTLVQVRKNDRFAAGKVDFRVAGKRGGAPASYDRAELAADSSKALAFKFRYFQNLEGTLTLPADFEPESVIVDVTPSGKGLKPVSRRFAWSSLIPGGT